MICICHFAVFNLIECYVPLRLKLLGLCCIKGDYGQTQLITFCLHILAVLAIVCLLQTKLI